MKKQVTVTKIFCDICGTEASGYTNCDCCKKEFCYECGKTNLIEYQHAVHFSGSGDGNYCHECDAKLIISKDCKHAAYRKIKSLRNEAIDWSDDFRKRTDMAEAKLKKLL